MHIDRKRLIYFVPVVIVKTKLRDRILKWSNHTLIERGLQKSYTIWTSHGEIDDALLEVDTGVGDDNSHAQDDGVFDGDDHGIDDDGFDYEELLRHVESHVLNSMGTDRGLNNMKILEKSSRETLYNESNGCGKEFTQLRVVLEFIKLKASHGVQQ
jgi:hypothetical protein